jgi:hypothetical protein
MVILLNMKDFGAVSSSVAYPFSNFLLNNQAIAATVIMIPHWHVGCEVSPADNAGNNRLGKIRKQQATPKKSDETRGK